jgi:hypothetical protein
LPALSWRKEIQLAVTAAGFVDFEITSRTDVYADAQQSSSAAEGGTPGITFRARKAVSDEECQQALAALSYGIQGSEQMAKLLFLGVHGSANPTNAAMPFIPANGARPATRLRSSWQMPQHPSAVGHDATLTANALPQGGSRERSTSRS